MKPVTDIKKLDKYQIQISLAAADADLPYALTDYHVLMVPDGFKDWAKPVGTGAFTLEKFDPGVRIVAEEASATTGRRAAAGSTGWTSPSSTTARRASTR